MGVNARLDLASFVTDQNDPPSPLTWTISGQYTGHFNAYIDRDGSTLRITPLRAGQENLTLTVRNRYNGTDSRTITVTVEGKRAPAPDPLRWPATVAVVAAAAAVLFLAGRAWRRAESAPGPQKRTGGQAPPKTGGKGR
jgi:PKD repeat protein